MAERVDRLNAYVEQYRSGDEYDRAAITHVMDGDAMKAWAEVAVAGGLVSAKTLLDDSASD